MQLKEWYTGDRSRKDDRNHNKIVTNKTDIYGVKHDRVRVISVLNNTFTGEDMETHFNRVYPIKELGNYEVKEVPAAMRNVRGRNAYAFDWKSTAAMKLTDKEINDHKIEVGYKGRLD